MVTLGVAIFFLYFFQPTHKRKAEDYALGKSTSSYRAKVNGLPIHCSTLTTGQECIEAAKTRGKEKTVL